MIVNFQFVDNSPVSVHLPIADEEEGLPSPPLDEGALFITQTADIQLSEVDGWWHAMDCNQFDIWDRKCTDWILFVSCLVISWSSSMAWMKMEVSIATWTFIFPFLLVLNLIICLSFFSFLLVLNLYNSALFFRY